MSKREVKHQAEITGPLLTLADLRWLVGQMGGMRDTSRVEVTVSSGDTSRTEVIRVHGVQSPPEPTDVYRE